MKKITILALHLGTGGAEQFISGLANILSEENEVEIISTYKLNANPAFYISPNVKIVYLKEGLKPNRQEFKLALKSKNIFSIIREAFVGLNILRLRKKLMIEAIKGCDSDIIVSTRAMHSKWLGKYGKPNSIKVAQEHNHHNNNPKIIKATVNSLKNIDYFMPTSKELTEFYAKLLNQEKTKCVYLPHWVDYFPEEKEVSKLDNKTLISVGRLSEVKAFPDLIDVFKLAHDIDDSLKLNIVGDGEEREKLEQRIKDYDLEDCVFLVGSKTREELNELYSKSDLYVMTSYTESFGLVLLEAEGFGIPLLAFDSAQGAHEIIENGKNGFFIKNRSKEIMAKKIIDLMRDEELRKNLGKAGRKMAEEHRIENLKNRWNNFFSSMCEEDENQRKDIQCK